MKTWKKTEVEDAISLALEEYSLEEILEDFDLDPVEVFVHLFQNGMIDEDILEERYGGYAIH